MEKTTVESKIREVIKERGITQSFIAKQADMKEADLIIRKFMKILKINLTLPLPILTARLTDQDILTTIQT